MIDWNSRVQEWSDYDAGLEYRDIPVSRLKDIRWERGGVYLLLSEDKKARISPDALYDLFVLCQKLQWSNKVRVVIPADAFDGTRASYRNLIRETLIALWKYREDDHRYTGLQNNPPRALFEKRNGRVTIVGVAPPRFALVSAPSVLKLCNPEQADWNYWGEVSWPYRDVVPSGTYNFSWSGWEEKEFGLTHRVGYWLLERNGVFVRFFCGYTGEIGTGAHIGVLVDGKRISIINLGNVVIASEYQTDWKVQRTIKILGLAWKLCFYGPLLDTVAQLRDIILSEQINNSIKQGMVREIAKEIESLTKNMDIKNTRIGSLSLEKVLGGSTLGDFVVSASSELSSGSDEIQQIYTEKILGALVVRVAENRDAWKKTEINRWLKFSNALIGAL